MVRTKGGYSGNSRGLVGNPQRSYLKVNLDNTQAIDLVRQITEALRFQRGVVVEPHFGKRTGQPPTNLIRVTTKPAE